MNIFKAFAQIGPLADNTASVVAPVGELAPISRTFARDLSLNSHSDFPGLTIVGFSYKVDDVAGVVPDPTAYSCLKAISWIYAQAKLGKFTEQKDSFEQSFIQQFGNDFDLIDSGRMIAFGSFWAPEYINIAPKGKSGTDLYRIWLADDSFYNQYDEYIIEVVPPIENIDLFFQDYDDVKALVAAIQQSDTFARMNKARGKSPETVPRTDVYTWQQPSDHSLKVDTNWVTVIYGLAGDNLDAVKEATRNYILAHSTHTRDEWAEIFPDLFTSTEFIITPMWDNFAIPNEVRQTGIFSAITSIQDAMALCHKTCKGVKYTDAHVDQKLCVVPSQYRSLMLNFVGGPENRDGVDLFSERYPDFINVPTTHVDFMRMSEETRQFYMMLAEMLMDAEVLTPNSGVPTGYNRLTRDGVVYLAKSFNKFLYLVVTKYSVDAALAPAPKA